MCKSCVTYLLTRNPKRDLMITEPVVLSIGIHIQCSNCDKCTWESVTQQPSDQASPSILGRSAPSTPRRFWQFEHIIVLPPWKSIAPYAQFPSYGPEDQTEISAWIFSEIMMEISMETGDLITDTEYFISTWGFNIYSQQCRLPLTYCSVSISIFHQFSGDRFAEPNPDPSLSGSHYLRGFVGLF